MKDFFAPRLLPALMIAAALGFGVRASDLAREFTAKHANAAQNPALIEPAAGPGVAQDAPAPPSQDGLASEDAPPPAPGKPVIEPPSMGAAPPAAPAVPAPAKTEGAGKDWKASDDLDDEYADVKMELFSDLSKRRKDLEAKEKELTMREALLKAAQAELEQKTQELLTIKTDIEGLLKQQTEQEDQRIASLVKIYEGMKAKDAAKIFNSLDMDVLIQVLTRMSERKSAPIIAAMDEEKARSVTIMLAEQNKLPELPGLPVQQ